MGVPLESTGYSATGLWSYLSKSLTDNRLTNVFKRRESQTDNTQNLPPEIKAKILEYCDLKGLLAMRSFSRDWNRAAQLVNDTRIHPLAWAILTGMGITRDGKNFVIPYKSQGPNGFGRESKITFVKSGGFIEVNDPKALLKSHELPCEYFLSPFWIFQENAGKKRVWKSPQLNDEKGRYFKRFVKGIKCPLPNVAKGKRSPEKYFLQRVQIPDRGLESPVADQK